MDAGETYVLFGPLSAGTLELSSAPDITLNGIDAGDQLGKGVGGGDINDDGAPDLIIGARFADPGGRTSAGETYVLFGTPPPPPPPVPSVTGLGLAALAVLVLGTFVWAMRGRARTQRI